MSSSALEASASIVESVFYYPHGAAQNFRSFERAVQDRPGSAQDLRDHLEGISSSSLSSSSSSLSSSSSSPSSEYFENENDGRTIDRGFGSALPASTSFAAVYPSLQDLLAQPVGREGMLSAYAGEAPDAVNARSAAMRACIGTIDQSMHKLFSELNLTAFDSVAQFIRGAFQEGGCCDPTPRTQSGDHFDHCQQFLPTAIVCAGLNLSDHGLSFRHLRTHLEKHCTPHVASLRARDCRRSKDCMSSLYLQFAGRDRRADDGVSSVRSGAGDATSLSSNAGSLQVALRDDEEEQHRRSRHTRETTIAVTGCDGRRDTGPGPPAPGRTSAQGAATARAPDPYRCWQTGTTKRTGSLVPPPPPQAVAVAARLLHPLITCQFSWSSSKTLNFSSPP